ncbi:hypothetical protein COV24_02705 [candidate division WWE3 bacterium CG10_big_fil_rev_8_21_14_0_10_32_10]|uniref:Uncharacterized protein n=1 Tax=candidate division WWE3 bacterium CG10_big_fil_rev_8_21_14_0_10_32_10 TaxID=1975090 RepID=A0A2H0RAC3_UNCKA|nr:MAG: hypothetical protein COV24_02705 [candidate division WWE3 bacterium CG10_big_fil_rev_8_21_14_0_10_32_10]
MTKQKKVNLIPLIVSLVIIGLLIYFIKPNKFITYAKAKLGRQNNVLIYELPKNNDNSKELKANLNKFLIDRGISGTAYEDSKAEYYVTITPLDVNPNTEKSFGFIEIQPEDFYKKVYNARQVYFTRTLKIIE